MAAVFPFGRPATRRPPRRPDGPADLLVLGVYPSALHVRWRRPDGVVIGALAVDDEPTVFWDGTDAEQRIARWRVEVDWAEEWGSVALAGGNGSSGRLVVDEILTPLGVAPEKTYFTDCLPYYFVKSGKGSQGQRINEVYQPFATAHHLPSADLPARPAVNDMVRRTVADEAGTLLEQLHESMADQVVTLGQEAADAFAKIVGADPVELRPDGTYGTPRSVSIADRRIDWVPLTHPGNRNPAWRTRHARWASDAVAGRL
jgi:uracil-DNA glycosylase